MNARFIWSDQSVSHHEVSFPPDPVCLVPVKRCVGRETVEGPDCHEFILDDSRMPSSESDTAYYYMKVDSTEH